MKAQHAKSYSLIAVLITAVALSVGGCMMLNNTPLGDLFNFDLLAKPSGDGLVGFNVLPSGAQAFASSVKAEDVTVEVKNSDGTYTECEPAGRDTVEGSKFNSLALLVDDSGSMERAYPEQEYGDLCLTCPHDPNRRRVGATETLINKVLDAGPESRLAVMDFGPTPSDGYVATRVLSDFSKDRTALVGALPLLDGSQMVGTPLWDSLGEVIGETKAEADDLEVYLQTEGIVDEESKPAEVRRFIVVLSDGDDRGDSKTDTLDTVIAKAKAAGVVIHAIGLGPASNQFESPLLQTTQLEEQLVTVEKLQRLAVETGGFYASVNDAAALQEVFEAVALAMLEGYEVEQYACEPDGEKPASGETIEGRIVDANGVEQTWSMTVP